MASKTVIRPIVLFVQRMHQVDFKPLWRHENVTLLSSTKNEAAFLRAAVTLLSDGHLITKAKLDFM